ncbi:MAG TPA: hypothetical protein VLS94_05305, partial [Fusibacter sp.]|nr:hypothetical protein [Fusibacter sp.]
LVLNVPMNLSKSKGCSESKVDSKPDSMPVTLLIRCDSGTINLDTLTLLKGDAHENHTDAL